MDRLKQRYEERYSGLEILANKLEKYLDEIIEHPRIDRISCRAKTVQSYAAKAVKQGDDGELKYTNPLMQIQDQIGARIVTFYKSDLCDVTRKVNEVFRHIEQKHHVPEKQNQFGYEGIHYVLFYPHEIIPTGMESYAPKFFELQIKTLFQHAWSEAEHDLGYKGYQLTEEERRKLAFTAAQAWGADQIFDELYSKVKNREVRVEKSTG